MLAAGREALQSIEASVKIDDAGAWYQSCPVHSDDCPPCERRGQKDDHHAPNDSDAFKAMEMPIVVFPVPVWYRGRQ